MKKQVINFLIYFKIHKLFRFFYRKKIIILMYHGFTDKDHQTGIENYQGKHIDIDLFKTQIAYMKKYYNIISLDDYIEFCTKDKKIPNNSIVITIDDGYRSNYTLAYPIFKEFNVPATIFITTDFVENKKYLWVDRLEYALNKTHSKALHIKVNEEKQYFPLTTKQEKIVCEERLKYILKSLKNETIEDTIKTIENKLNIALCKSRDIPKIYNPLEWNEILEMVKSSKVKFGSHTHKHLILAIYDNEVIKNDLALAKNIIESKTGVSTKLFCYPNGSRGDFNEMTKHIIKEAEYSCALTTVYGINSKFSDLFELKRIGIGNTNLKSFVINISGIKNFVSQMRTK